MANSGVHKHWRNRFLTGLLSLTEETPPGGRIAPRDPCSAPCFASFFCAISLLVLVCCLPARPSVFWPVGLELSRASPVCPVCARDGMESRGSSEQYFHLPWLTSLHSCCCGGTHIIFEGLCRLPLPSCCRTNLGELVSQICLHQSLSWGCSDGTAGTSPPSQHCLQLQLWLQTHISSSWLSASLQEWDLLPRFCPCIHPL